jgi:D-glycero-D-manno-heptose 1,7-bisphosphate phosphatase
MNKAVFLDRDGVINELVFNKKRKEFEPPHSIADFVFRNGVLLFLKKLQKNNFLLFIVSNQPDYAKGKVKLKGLKNIHSFFDSELKKNNIYFSEYYYCYHHPQGIVKRYTLKCECRKPNNLFVLSAIKKFSVDKSSSWFIGDRDSDIECGKKSGLKTILILNKNSVKYQKVSKPDFKALNLKEAAEIVTKKS